MSKVENKLYFVCIGLLLVVSLAVCSFGFNASDNDKVGVISATGECIKSVVADKHKVNVYVEFVAKTSEVASKEVLDSYKNAIEDLKKIKGLEFNASDYSVNKHREWNGEKKIYKDLGFKAYMSFEVISFDKDVISKVVAKISGKKNVFVRNTEDYVSMKKMKEIKADCLDEALKDAKGKAEKMADALDVEVEGVQSVSIQNDRGYSPRMMMAKSSQIENFSSDKVEVPEMFDTKKDLNIRVSVDFFIN